MQNNNTYYDDKINVTIASHRNNFSLCIHFSKLRMYQVLLQVIKIIVCMQNNDDVFIYCNSYASCYIYSYDFWFRLIAT